MRAALLTCAFAVVLASASPTEAATIHVPAQQPSIQAGVSAASQGDTVLVAPDTYTGPENRDIDFGGVGITLISSGGPSVTILDCGSLGRGFNFHSGEDTTAIVGGFTIRNATTPPGVRSLGGGIYCSTASPIIIDCVFEDCVADDGGAIWSSSSSEPTIEHCSFLGNTADDGGAIHTVSSGGVIRDCTFEDNTAELGGAILIGFFGEPLIDDCTFEGNIAEYGGGIYYMSAESSISDCVFYDNTAILGAGLYIQSSWNLPSISGCTFARNTGGGVYNLMGELEFVRCIFAFDRSDVGL
ncbi:MAG: right-handed parallel beta-helix repeat-containing protein, partial [Spirochaetaceae bacterium]|nr:right-handed parallel beta-helix repeat-containing protein [Spirochaetaceae bacterium]